MIPPKNAPAATGPYSQAVRGGSFIFTSGQIPIDPESGRIVEGDIAVQTRRVLQNVEAVLTAFDLTLADVVRATLFIRDMSQLPAINQAYAEYFPSDPPARCTVEVGRLPMDAVIEIEVIAFAGRLTDEGGA